MPDLVFERHVPHAPDRMYALVGDLARYPSFVPNCYAMDVKRDRGQPGDVRFARMTVKFGPLTQSYTSRVVSDPEAMTIEATAVDGPFSHLVSKWVFEPEGEGSRIRFDIDFKFSNPLVAKLAEPAFAAKQTEIVDAFIEEADRRYGG